ncbi:MAG: hypothetical protein P1V97_27255 [Planctomycetota bacterium]|nr:hypothetical protein [Planctomycetota bacterium]
MSPKNIIEATKGKALETKEKVLETKDKVVTLARETVEETRETLEETKDKVTTLARETVEETRETLEETKSKVEKTIEKVEKSNLFQTLFRVNRNLTLAGLGAIALVGDQLTGIGEKCLERGEDVEQVARDIATDGIQRIKGLVKKAPAVEEAKVATPDAKGEVKMDDKKAEVKVEATKLEV